MISPRGFDTGGATSSEYATSYGYDALSRPVRITLPKASGEAPTYTHTAYDANGRLQWTSLPTTQDQPGNVAAADKTVNEYWDTSGLYSTMVGGSAKVRYDYTAEGWQAWRLPETAEGTGVADYSRMMFWEYYRDGLLAAERDLSGQRSSYGYDANGNQTSASEAQSIVGETLAISATFDGFDQLTKVRTPKTGTANYWASLFAYDRHGNASDLVENQEESPAGSVLTPGRVFATSFDAADQPQQQTDDYGTVGTAADDERFSFTFDDLGRLASRTLAKNTGSWVTEQALTRTYFDNGLLKTLLTENGAGAMVNSHTLGYTSGGVYLNGNRASDTFRLVGPDGSAPCRMSDCTASWDYDGRGRLTKEVNGSGTTSEFTLDITGNVTLEKRNGAVYRSATYTGQRLTTDTTSGTSLRYLYDGQGNVDCVVLASWASNSCPAASSGQAVAGELVSDNVYDYRNRLVAVRGYDAGSVGDRSEYRYDPLSRPIRKIASEAGTTTTTDFVYLGVSDAVVRETETGPATTMRSYAFDALGQRATLSHSSGATSTRLSYVYDPHGSVEGLLDQANTVQAAYGYLPYGEANNALTKTAAGFSASTNQYRYTGKRWDAAAKAYDMGARHYTPRLGRWLQQDLYPDALDNLALSLDPLTQNRYAFTAANPVNLIELDGHRVMADGGPAPGRRGSSPTAKNPNTTIDKPASTPAVRCCVTRITRPGPTILITKPGLPGTSILVTKPAPRPPKCCITLTPIKKPTSIVFNKNAGQNSTSEPDDAAKAADDAVDLASPGRTRHILQGDATGGGHLWPGRPGKTPFPRDWSADRVMQEISDVATDPASRVVGRQGRRTVLEGTRDGVRIRVVTDGRDIITGYPTNLPRKP